MSWNKASNRCTVCRFFQQTRCTFRHDAVFAFFNSRRAPRVCCEVWSNSGLVPAVKNAVKSRQCDNAAQLGIRDERMPHPATADSPEIP
jgi:hypothetical protein